MVSTNPKAPSATRQTLNSEVSTYLSVQALRAFGALLVVAFHACLMAQKHLDPNAPMFVAGAAGVDLFFVISGFIMVVATQGYAGQPNAPMLFLMRRLIRIVPLYWIVTSVKLVILAAGGTYALTAWHSIASYLFIPAWDPDNKPFPLLVAGWTLSYEMFFYLAFAVVLFFRKPVLPTLGIAFLALAVVGEMFGPFAFAPLTLLNQRLLEFVLGIAIAQGILGSWRLPKTSAITLLLTSIIWLAYTNTLPSHITEQAMLIIWGIPSAILVYAALSLDRARIWRMPLLQQLGDASYAIYLTHEFAVSAVKLLVLKLYPSCPYLLAVAASLIAASVVGILIYRLVEAPLQSRLKSVISRC